eukprot:scaffold15259_cov122-Cylindrotheca_fusiformis.AAC.3
MFIATRHHVAGFLILLELKVESISSLSTPGKRTNLAYVMMTYALSRNSRSFSGIELLLSILFAWTNKVLPFSFAFDGPQ